jgi:maltooligosyltrehalose trehalohydrolase
MKRVGATYSGDASCNFTVWAPLKERMQLHIVHPVDKVLAMQKDGEGYFHLNVESLYPGAQYFFRPDGARNYPDPVSNYQPEGVHGPSEVVDHNEFIWNDADWQLPSFKDLVLYELHVGTFTEDGTFEAIIGRLDDLVSLGINAIELMPVAQFPGNRNWGYDGVLPYAVQNSYGGPAGLKKLVNACHTKGIAVFLDVVYNHMGPEGNYLSQFGPYFTKKYCTPWGDAINFDDEWCDGVRDYFAGNAIYWFEQFHIDGLRCDAIHTVFDNSAVHFWEYLYQQLKELEQKRGRSFYLIAESDLNSPKVIRQPDYGGYGFTAQWLDDFHHALYTLLDQKGKDRYEDFGDLAQLAKGYTDGFVHSGEWVKFRKRRFGRSSAGVPGDNFVVFNQNHDQIGNRVKGERLCMLVNFEHLKVAAAGIFLAPYVPMLFMGEEYGDESPFYYFVSHSDPELIKAVQKGRREEFAAFGFEEDPPNPQDESTFDDCKLKWQKRKKNKHALLLQWHQTLIVMRQQYAALQNFNKTDVQVETIGQDLLIMHRHSASGEQYLICLFNFSDKEISYQLPDSGKKWNRLLYSREQQWIEQAPSEASCIVSQVNEGVVHEKIPSEYNRKESMSNDIKKGSGEEDIKRSNGGEDAKLISNGGNINGIIGASNTLKITGKSIQLEPVSIAVYELLP